MSVKALVCAFCKETASPNIRFSSQYWCPNWGTLQGEVSVWTLLLRTFECSPAIVSLCCGHLMSRCCTTVIEWTLHSPCSQTSDLNPTPELCDRDETNLFREWVWIWIFAIQVTRFESNPESDKICSINLDLEGEISKKLWIRIFGIEGKRFDRIIVTILLVEWAVWGPLPVDVKTIAKFLWQL